MMQKAKKDAEVGARRAVLEDLFYDFHSSRRQVYWLNFVRGIFFGLGSVLGATIVVALLLWILSQLVGLPGGIGEFIESIRNNVQNYQKP
jgi:hypothetical protein